MFSISRRLRPFLILAVAGLPLGACLSTSQSAAITPLPADWITSGHIDRTEFVDDAKVKVSDHFDKTFTDRLQAKLDGCAKGSRPLVLKANVARLSRSNGAVTVLSGSARNKVLGEAQLIDESTGKVVGDYKIGQTIYGTRLATLEMLKPEHQLADAFGEEVCRQAFPAPTASR
jgi:hypothetical protein